MVAFCPSIFLVNFVLGIKENFQFSPIAIKYIFIAIFETKIKALIYIKQLSKQPTTKKIT